MLQLINPKTERAARLDSEASVAAHVTTYSAELDALATSLASQAAVALENSLLWAEIQQPFEGFVRASVIAIESRDPITAGHSFRVANPSRSRSRKRPIAPMRGRWRGSASRATTCARSSRTRTGVSSRLSSVSV